MARGKNFNAAEKHFEKKRLSYEKKIRCLTLELDESRKESAKYKELYQKSVNENTQLKEWVERLLEYTELSKEDIERACKKDIQTKESLEKLSALFKFSGLYY